MRVAQIPLLAALLAAADAFAPAGFSLLPAASSRAALSARAPPAVAFFPRVAPRSLSGAAPLRSARVAPSMLDLSTADPKDVRVFVAGSTGYIGRFVTKELIKRGYNVVAFSREKSGVGSKKSVDDVRADFVGADCRFGDVTDMESLRSVGFKDKVDVVVSCLASRTGGVEDSNTIDYQASKNCLEALSEQGGTHYVLLSAFWPSQFRP
ncbi:hypothetical protein T484DRAFT_1815650 [Baffinella frigidus]|nr:hypothetical protein T484DRAFT_1815650 [Cryptophyta sp. CCMP2293]